MKRIFVKIILLMNLIVFIALKGVYADEKICQINIKTKEKSLKEGDILELSIELKENKSSKGITKFVSNIEYDKNIFEILTVEDNDIKEEIKDTELKAANIIYSGMENVGDREKTAWYILNFENFIYGNNIDDPETKDGELAKIKMKVKKDATVGNTIVALKNTEVYTVDNINEEGKIEGKPNISDSSSVEVNILSSNSTSNDKKKENDTTNSITSGKNENTIKNNKVNNINVINNSNVNNKSNNKTNNNLPYAGRENIVPIIVLILIISIILYKKYKEYEEI